MLVTGASAGIGKAFALEFASHGFDVALTARRKKRLEQIAGEIEGGFGVKTYVIPSDLAEPLAPKEIAERLDLNNVSVDALVNNAGYGLPQPFHTTTWEQQRDFIQVLVTSGVELVHRLLPGMIERRYGRIINVASLAGLLVGGSGYTLYSGAKAFMIKFSEALSLENDSRNVYVTAVCPGFTLSEFHDAAGVREGVSRLPSFLWMDAEAVARQGYEAVMNNRLLLVNGGVNQLIALMAKFTPMPVARWMARKASHRMK